ncbi:kinase-like domain-containing protein [Ephemerocybe angulata]|uniref:Kinase-like domain-containing protein n=1 Tax=Ephemerocybe angulata TaxID=980116 RepID=A0A8H6HGX7_9AGAR|nr:kinase-like domain-containing protein [Tulosesus angulatus]
MPPAAPAPPTRCSGCSGRFPLMPNDGRRCGACQRRSEQLTSWPQCRQCGDTYEFLGDNEPCGDCVEFREGSGQLAQNAVTQPVNPRAHSTHRGADDQASESDERREKRVRAAQIVGHMAASHGNAVARASQGAMVAPSKLKGTHPEIAPTPTAPKAPGKIINVRIDKLCNVGTGKKNGAGPPNFVPQNFEMADDTSMESVLAKLLALTDAEYTRGFNMRVYFATALIIMWVASKTEVDPDFFTGRTLGEFWQDVCSNPNFVKAGDKGKRRIDLYILVKWDPNATVDEDGFKVPVRQKSELGTSLQSLSDAIATKKPRECITPSGSSTYRTEISETTSVRYSVEKFCWTKGDSDGILRWTKVSKAIQVTVEKEHFAAGKTKQAFKMTIGGNLYAAKCFFDVGNGSIFEVSNEDNLAELKNELLRQDLGKRTAERFVKQAQDLEASVYNICVDDAFILVVVDGPEEGHAWIVDKIYEDAEIAIRKFSGTDQAGGNDSEEDLVGRTCDAFAHYAYYDSVRTLVFVDIEGIDTGLLPAARRNRLERPRLVLFDLMVHSSEKLYGLGDKGEKGLNTFGEQHQCNSICTKFGLPPIDIGDGSGDDGGDEDTAPSPAHDAE